MITTIKALIGLGLRGAITLTVVYVFEMVLFLLVLVPFTILCVVIEKTFAAIDWYGGSQ